MRSRAQVYGTTDIRANEEGASAATDRAGATNRAWATDHPGATNRADLGNAQTRQPTAHRRRSRRQSIDWLSAQQPDANATTRNRQRAHSSMRDSLQREAPRGAFEVTSMIRRMSRISAMLVGRIARQEDSPSGLWRTLGKRVGCKPSGVRIPHPPQASGDGLSRRAGSRHFPLSHNEKSMFGRNPKIPPSIAVYRRISPRRGTFGGTISKREGVFFARRL